MRLYLNFSVHARACVCMSVSVCMCAGGEIVEGGEPILLQGWFTYLHLG